MSPDTDLVAVHDAVRPFIDLEIIEKVIDEAGEYRRGDRGHRSGGHREAGERRAGSGAKIRSTISRERLVLAQTPQVFRYDLLKQAFEAARRDGFVGHR